MGSIRGWRLRIVNFSSLVRQGDAKSYMAIAGEVFGGRTSTKTLRWECTPRSQEWQGDSWGCVERAGCEIRGSEGLGIYSKVGVIKSSEQMPAGSDLCLKEITLGCLFWKGGRNGNMESNQEATEITINLSEKSCWCSSQEGQTLVVQVP